MFYEADLDIFFQEFGQKALYGDEYILAIIDTDYVLALNNQGFAGVEAYDIMATVRTSDVEGIKHDDKLILNPDTDEEKTYYVKGIQHTGSGTTMLFLSESL